MAVSHEIHTYAELRQQIHDDLRMQHPEWVQPNGECPICDSYEARLMEELDSFRRTGSDETIADIHRALGHGLNRIKTAPARHADSPGTTESSAKAGYIVLFTRSAAREV
jgi:hypothetical protein